MAQEFSVGDVVELKSGGPKMTVKQIIDRGPHEDTVIWCAWFAGAKYEKNTFAPETLVHAQDEKGQER